MVTQVKKRDGAVVEFKISKIADAIEKTMLACGIDNEDLPKQLAEKVGEEANSKYPGELYIPTVEEIQDIVEKTLINQGQAEMAKAYILYRQKRAELRKLKQSILGRFDDSKLSVNGLLVAKSRYLMKDESGSVIESPKEMFRRVAKSVSDIEKKYKMDKEKINALREEFFEAMNGLEFIPGGRILANAGTKKGMLYSSFVIPVNDSMKGIFRALYDKALIQRQGGGTGFSFTRLRAKGTRLTSSTGFAAGPIAFIKLFDHASDLTIHVGNRKAANMGSLSVEHPDIVEFITMKDRREIKNFNVSVEITDNFMQAVKNNGKYPLKDPGSGEVVDMVDANNIFHLITTMAWKTGDPGVLFIDRINQSNPLPKVSRIETTDPCGDQLLLPYEGGNVGAINLSKFVRSKKIKWKRLEEVIRLGVRFLDNVVDLSSFPTSKAEEMAKGTRRIGLGVMGFADMLYKLNIPYNSEKAIETAEKIMKFISGTAYSVSEELASEKGVFGFYDSSIYKGEKKLRNASIIAISPTGSRSILADTSPGIEPNFGLGYIRKVLGNMEITHINRVIEDVLKEHNLYSEDVVRGIINKNSLSNVNIPEEIKNIFVTAYNITPEWHVSIQAAFQKYIDNAISKTVNFRKGATIEDIKKVFMMAYESGCRGVTVYREGSLSDEVITLGR